jgi:hypothetical protein
MKYCLVFIIILINFRITCQIPEIIPYRKGSLWGYVNTKKEIKIPIGFTKAEPFTNGSAIVKEANQFKLIDQKGNTLSSYDSIVRVANYPNLLVLLNGKWGLVDPKGKVLVSLKYAGAYSEDKAFVSIWDEASHPGRLDVRSGAVYISEGCTVYEPEKGYAQVTKDDLHGIIDSAGRLIVPIKFNEAQLWGAGTIMTAFYKEEDGKFGLYNRQGMEILKPEYNQVGAFKDGIAKVCKNDVCGFMDSLGKFVLPLKYKYASEFSEGIAYYYDETNLNEPFSFINLQGQVLYRKSYSEIGKFSEGLCMVGRNINGSQAYGYINAKGEEVITVQFDAANAFSEGLALVARGSAWFIIDKTGKPINDAVYSNVIQNVNSEIIEPCFKSGKIRLEKQTPGGYGRYMGMVNLKGEVITPFQYEEIGIGGSQLICWVRIPGDDKAYGFVDSASGKPITELKYSYVYPFVDGMAMVAVSKNGKGYCGFINSVGEEAVEIKYDAVKTFSEGIAAVKLGEFWGFVDKKGKVAIDFKYEHLQYLHGMDSGIKNGLIKVFKNNKQGYIDINGNEYFED